MAPFSHGCCDEAAEALRERVSFIAAKFVNGSAMTCGLQSCIPSSSIGEAAGVVATEVRFDFLDGGALSAKESTSDSSAETS